MDHVGEGKVAVTPLFAAITSKMEIAFEGDSGGGPRREFKTNTDATRPLTTSRKTIAPAGVNGRGFAVGMPLTGEDPASA
jgi:hypothetical protein